MFKFIQINGEAALQLWLTEHQDIEIKTIYPKTLKQRKRINSSFYMPNGSYATTSYYEVEIYVIAYKE